MAHRPATVFCGDCGEPMVLSLGPGRLRDYRGEPGYLVPPDLAYWRCPSCGAEGLTTEQIERLGAELERQRRDRRRAA